MIRSRSILALAPVLLATAFGCGGGTPPATAPTTASPEASSAAPTAPSGTPAPGAAAPAPSATVAEGVAPAGEAADEDDDSTTELKDHHRHHHHGGFAMFVAMSLGTLGTTPEQKAAITSIQTTLHAKMMPAHDAEKAVLLALANGVAAGKIDPAKIDAAIAKVSTAAAGVHDAVADAMNQLHATLTPPQRAALVGKVEAHYAVWHKENGEDEPAERDAHGGQLGKLTKDLGLSADQVEKIRASFKTSIGGGPAHFDASEAEAHLKAFGAAFASDTFDAKSLTTGGPANAHIATWGATRMAKFYEAVGPALTAPQRTKLAEQLRRHANYKRTQTAT